MGIWDKVKNNSKKLKLQGEISLLKREVNTRQKSLGVELYNIITNDKNKLLGMSAGTLFKSDQEELKDAFERARDDIANVGARKDILQNELDVLEVKSASTLPNTTVEQKMNKAGRAISNGARGTKLQAQMALLDREMKIRKEQFGVEVFADLKPSEGGKEKNPIKRISNAVAGLSKQEQDIMACIDTAIADVVKIEGRMKSKQHEISSIDEEMEPML